MLLRPRSPQLPSVSRERGAIRLRASYRRWFSNTLSSMRFTNMRDRSPNTAITRSIRRQAGCMARTDKREAQRRVPSDVSRAIAAAEDKKASDLVVLDLRKASGFADYFL